MHWFLRGSPTLFAVLAASVATPALAADPQLSYDASELMTLKAQLDAQRRDIEEQRRALEAQRARIQGLEDRLLDRMRAAGVGGSVAPAVATQTSQAGGGAAPASSGVETVGSKPADEDRPPDVAVLADQGGVITKAGRFTIEPNFEYARADRNRFVFRGIEVPQSVLVGVFDINESRQDVATAAVVGRFGITNRLEVGARVPWVYRSDTSVLVPLVDNDDPDAGTTINNSAHGSGIGDIELMARYQLTNGTGGSPFLIAGLQVIAPTGTHPFELPRDALGNATKSATGSGFWGVAPSLTVLMPSDPATLFGSLSYTYNFGRNINKRISNALIERVEPGGAPSATAGIGIALNQRTSVSFAYAHSWQFATKSRIRLISISNGIETIGDPITSESRDLQIGRYLFGISYRLNARTTISWSVEVGATDDANDVRTSLRIPFTLN